MRLSTRFWLVFLAGVLLLSSGAVLCSAQLETGVICVATFADTNGNGLHDAAESALAGVNVNLATGGVIIATHIMAEGEASYCFDNLLTGFYTITFTDSPLYRATTATEGTFSLDGGQRMEVNPFGAVPIPLDNLREEVAIMHATTEEKLDMSTRLLLATSLSMLVMLFMIGVGAVILGLMTRPSAQRRRPRSKERKRSRKQSGHSRKTQEIAPPPEILPPPR